VEGFSHRSQDNVRFVNRILEDRFQLQANGTTLRREVMAGLVSFVTGAYVVVVNARLMAEAGMPLAGATVASAVAAGVGSLLMGLWANAPLMVVTGLGDAALFTYTLVQGIGLAWQEALAVVCATGLLCSVVAFTPALQSVLSGVPASLRAAISAGVGLFLAFIGLRQGGLIVSGGDSLVALGDLGDPQVLLTLITLAITVVLYLRRVPGAVLISIGAGSLLAWAAGHPGGTAAASASLAAYRQVAGALSPGRLATLPFWAATFTFTMVVLFENLGLMYGLLPRKEEVPRALQANALAVFLAGLLGATPTVAAAEGAAGIAAGGRTGLTAVTAGVLFLASLGALPVVGLIPNSAIAPVLVLVGALMCEPLRTIAFDDLTEAIPAFLVILLIPLTFSVANGIAFGLVAYPLVKAAAGRWREVSPAMYVVAALFLLYFLIRAA